MKENKYPSIKYTKEAWERILSIASEWGCDIVFSSNIDHAQFIVSNYDNPASDTLVISTSIKDNIWGRRYLVNSVDEFLSAVAKLAGKVYPSSKSSASSKEPLISINKNKVLTLKFNL